ncbi:dimethylaniline monooxygenase [N-oxide-forming] 3-like isoform X2 [Contarinia nasturtii]|uniref:dimethylaniline monooxygenase [N-oxide-forming] 3-like isoform X2 n=1 Tax=Contarinia nasturtii TaxID=265458 RepID=UPI0012D4C1B6|nr:dimethylaniline monooxygenase [N-oxide-forming] 3-like isoform X2 [Contarinia nasturtii]
MAIHPKYIDWFLLTLSVNFLQAAPNSGSHKINKLKIAVIGAGVSGLSCAKSARKLGHDVVIWEQGEALGGIWFYTEKTGKDEYEDEIHTPMYKELRANTPYQLLEFSGWKFPNGTNSYPSQAEVWNYINSYAKHFGIDKLIKFHHRVDKVESIKGDKWKITVTDKIKNYTKTDEFDAICVCSGVFALPIYPNIRDIDRFKGEAIHSRHYRNAKAYEDKDVLIVGAGPSGKDITIHVATYANRVTLSRHIPDDENEQDFQKLQVGFGPKVTLRGEVQRLTENGAEFKDGTYQTFDSIIFATGFDYSYPFLDESTGIHVKDNYIEPLYKHIINIEHPTMAFIGGVVSVAAMPIYDLQARFALQFITKAKKLPPYEDMKLDMQTRNEAQWNKGIPNSKTHSIGSNIQDYANQLAETAGIPNIPTVISDIFIDSRKIYKITDPFGFRSNVYTIKSDAEFKRERL